jgi:hypothetical protein
MLGIFMRLAGFSAAAPSADRSGNVQVWDAADETVAELA